MPEKHLDIFQYVKHILPPYGGGGNFAVQFDIPHYGALQFEQWALTTRYDPVNHIEDIVRYRIPTGPGKAVIDFNPYYYYGGSHVYDFNGGTLYYAGNFTGGAPIDYSVLEKGMFIFTPTGISNFSVTSEQTTTLNLYQSLSTSQFEPQKGNQEGSGTFTSYPSIPGGRYWYPTIGSGANVQLSYSYTDYRRDGNSGPYTAWTVNEYTAGMTHTAGDTFKHIDPATGRSEPFIVYIGSYSNVNGEIYGFGGSYTVRLFLNGQQIWVGEDTTVGGQAFQFNPTSTPGVFTFGNNSYTLAPDTRHEITVSVYGQEILFPQYKRAYFRHITKSYSPIN